MKPADRPSPGYVYFIAEEDRDRVKIGKATDVEARVGDLQTSTSSELIVMGVLPHERPHALERFLHKRFGASRIRGEWFTLTEEIRDFINLYAFELEGARVWRMIYGTRGPKIAGAWDWV